MGLLASVIAEHTLDTHAGGWFVTPWRCGLNAARLARFAATLEGVCDWYAAGITRVEEVEILATIDVEPLSAETYERASRLYNRLTFPKISANSSRFAAAALRCRMLYLSHSDGGGPVYNEVLYPVFAPIPSHLTERLVAEWRCQDAIGTTLQFRGDKHDRERGAFRIAWQRGLYHAAYSIKPVSK